MIIYSNIYKKKFWNKDNLFIIADFDGTITSHDSINTWSLLSKIDLIEDGFANSVQQLYNYYRPIELNNNLSLKEKENILGEWWKKEVDLLIKYKLTEEMINRAVVGNNNLIFREGIENFLYYLYKNEIPLIIKSAGVTDVINQSLILKNVDFPNISIISNKLIYENGYVNGVEGKIITSFNKSTFEIPEDIQKKIINRNNIILLGDSLEDSFMINDMLERNILKICFMNQADIKNLNYYYKLYDIISFDENTEILFSKILRINK